jgi:hypothetical protein
VKARDIRRFRVRLPGRFHLTCWPNGKVPDYGAFLFAFFVIFDDAHPSTQRFFLPYTVAVDDPMPPARGKKRKEDVNAPASGTRRPRASQSATRAMEHWVDHLAEVPSTAAHMSSLCRSIQSSPLLVQAMVQCQERFVQVIAAQLVADFSTKEDAKVHRVGESQVHAALRALGMDDISAETQRLQQATGPRERPPKRKKQPLWTGEEIAEQERLLASSKERMMGKL